jgi:tRNA pseudouridine55 synthase
MDGIVIIDKPKGHTSREIVDIVGKNYKTRKVGHTGTLDPLATGVLVICIGKATKIVELITSYDKEYIATFKFGVLTDSLDSEGNIINDNKIILEEEHIKRALKELTGTYMQEVPIYSAVRINGKKLYEYAREGLEVELPKHEVTISSLELLNISEEDGHTIIKVKCHVSKGTYIRSLGNDIAKKLGTTAIMTDLRRTKQGDFLLEEAVMLDALNQDTKLISIKDCLSNYKTVKADKNLEEEIRNGKILNNKYESESVLFEDEKGEILALYKVYEKDNKLIKPWKMFITR